MQALKCCNLYIPLLFGWQCCLQHNFNQFNFIYNSLLPLDPKCLLRHESHTTEVTMRAMVFPGTNTNTHLICAVSLRSGFISRLWWAKVKALPAISHLLLFLDVALGLPAVQPAYRTSQPFLQCVGGALGARRALDGVEGWLRLQVGHWIRLAPVVIGRDWICIWKKTMRWEITPAPLLFPSAHEALGSPKHDNTSCLDERFCDLWTLCKLYCTPERGICPAMGIFHNLTHFSHFLPHDLSLWKIARQQSYLVFDESLNFMLSAEFLSFLPQISLWIARKKISTKSRLLQETWQPPTLCQVPIP